MQYKVLFKRCLLAIVVMFVVTSTSAAGNEDYQ